MAIMETFGAVWIAARASWDLYREGRSIQSLKEDLINLKSDLSASQESEARLQQQVSDGNQRIAELQAELRSWQAFRPIRGVLFRQLPDGDFEEAIYCPRCKVPMFAQEDKRLSSGEAMTFRLVCDCGHRSMVTRAEARGILARLNR